jgi:antitoxin (DNA-binding transcriptional repressor) of toxin-antitoxin stability system
MERISATQAARQFSDLLNRVVYQGQSFEVERGNRVVARLGPADTPVKGVPITELNRLFAELPSLHGDGDAFAADLEVVRRALPPESDPWA